MMNLSSALLLIIFSLVGCVGAEQTQLVFSNSSTTNSNSSSYNQSMQVSSRNYTASVLKQVFDIQAGTSADNEITNNIYRKIEFGGACDPYGPSDLGTGVIEFPQEQCTNGIGFVQGSNSNPMRYSLTTKVCENLLANNTALNAVKLKITSSGSWPEPTEQNVSKAWQLFYTVDAIDSPTAKALADIKLATSDNEEAWKAIIFTVCSSPAWQVI